MENYQANTPSVPIPPPRPVFLTVLCVLTFIGSSWGIINGIRTYMSANTAAQIIGAATEESREQLQKAGDEGSKVANEVLSGISGSLNPANIKKNSLFSIVSSILTLIGGFLMFQLKKPGFYSYVLGTLVGIVGPFVAFGSSNFLGIITGSAMAFFGILFVVLYALNLKYLK